MSKLTVTIYEKFYWQKFAYQRDKLIHLYSTEWHMQIQAEFSEITNTQKKD